MAFGAELVISFIMMSTVLAVYAVIAEPIEVREPSMEWAAEQLIPYHPAKVTFSLGYKGQHTLALETRGKLGAYDRQLDQLLLEVDGMTTSPGVFVVGATNRPRAVDPALRRGGRLSRTITLPMPDVDERLRILQLLSHAMPLRGVDLDDVALDTEGYSGADLKALLQQSAIESMFPAPAGKCHCASHMAMLSAGASTWAIGKPKRGTQAFRPIAAKTPSNQ